LASNWQHPTTPDNTRQHPTTPDNIQQHPTTHQQKLAIPDSGALTKLIFGGDGEVVNKEGNAMVPALPATLEVGMTEADFRNKNLGVGGAIIISAWLTHRDKGAMTKFDISSNEILAEGGKALAAGLKGNQVITELNIAGNGLGQKISGGSYVSDTSGVVAIANAIPDMRAMTSLNLAWNCLCGIDEYGDGVYDASGTACSVSCLV
jgi:hypothetical protein